VWRTVALGPQPAKALPAGIPSLSARACGACHPQQLADWSASRMGRAMTDPVFLADWEHQGDVFVCRNCHTPLVEQRPTLVTGLRHVKPLTPIEGPNPRFVPELVEEGVTCVACHLIDGEIVGPDGDHGPHAVRADPTFREPQRCVGCHQVPIPPLTRLQRPLADTHAEWEEWRRVTGRTEVCADCHMPGRRHTFPGAWDADLVKGGLAVAVEADGDEVIVTLENRAGHRFPSADPSRALVVRHGTQEVVIARRVPLPKMKELGDDTLLPAERRELRFRREDADVVVEMQPIRFLPSGPDEVAVPIATVSAAERQ
jgi:hypothetical protein